ncbi:plasma membrane calcium, partial [Nowakowskiella sp. JEL0078]
MCKVIRDSHTISIPVTQLLVGDILCVEGGDVLPADGLFLSGYNIQCDESAQTGEPMGISKNEIKDPFFLSGTKVVNGMGKVVVIAVGPHSVNGLSMLALDVEPDATPLQKKLTKLADQIAKLGSAAALIMIIALVILFFALPNRPTSSVDIIKAITDIFVSAVTLVVVAVPEGLPLAVTLALAYATIRMLKDNNLVRHLMACETMGNATTICSDKTGTLTLNRMTVVQGVIFENKFANDNIPQTILNDNAGPINRKMLEILATSVNINSTASETQNDKGVTEFIGSKTEVALLQFTNKLGFKYSKSREVTDVIEVIPFSSQRKRMVTVVSLPKDNDFEKLSGIPQISQSNKEKSYYLFNKGASEIILSGCTHFVDSFGKVQIISQEERTRFEKIINTFASQALRTIALSMKPVSSDNYAEKVKSTEQEESEPDDSDLSNLIYLGVVGIQDPLRPEVPEAVSMCQKAGITVRMVTGDNLTTARAIARGCGILRKNGIVMEGPQFRQLSDEEMDEILPNLQVLARSSPNDKQILVNRLRKLKETVAVTGDGTNDAPALKSADVGFSMGIAGTEVAKEASDIVLMDDNFASLVKAVMWGRSVYDSVRKFLQFQLTVNVSAVVVTIVTSIVSTIRYQVPDSALTAVQLLWVNLIMDTFAALALATDAATAELLNRNPSNRSEPLVSFHMWRQIAGQSVYQIFACLFIYGYGPEMWPAKASKAGTQGSSTGLDLHTSGMIFNTFVFMQVFNLLNSRSLTRDLNIFHNVHKNLYFMTIWFGTIVVQVLIISFAGIVFKIDTNGFDGIDWLICLAFGFGSIIIGFIIRLIPDWRSEIPVSEKPVENQSDTVSEINIEAVSRISPTPKSPEDSTKFFEENQILLKKSDATIKVKSPEKVDSHELPGKTSTSSLIKNSPRQSTSQAIPESFIVELSDESGAKLFGLLPQPMIPEHGHVLTAEEYRKQRAHAGWQSLRRKIIVVNAFKSTVSHTSDSNEQLEVSDEDSEDLPRRNSRGGKELWRIARTQTLQRISVVQAFRRTKRDDFSVMQILDPYSYNDARASDKRKQGKANSGVVRSSCQTLSLLLLSGIISFKLNSNPSIPISFPLAAIPPTSIPLSIIYQNNAFELALESRYSSNQSISKSYLKFAAQTKWNHLSVDPYASNDLPGVVFVDGRNVSVLLKIPQINPLFKKVVRLFQIPSNSDPSTSDQEMPSHCFASCDHLILNSGCGALYLLRLNRSDPTLSTKLLGTVEFFESKNNTEKLGSCKVLDALELGDGRFAILIMRLVDSVVLEDSEIARPGLGAAFTSTPATSSLMGETKRIEVNVELLLVSSIISDGEGDPLVNQVLTQFSAKKILSVSGSSIPHIARIRPSGSGINVAGESPFRIIYPQPDRSIISKPEKRDINWQQTESEITISLQLSSKTQKKFISCIINADRVGVSLKLNENEPTVIFPFSQRLSGTIIPSDCIWTLEDSGTVVSLQLQKANVGHWVDLFSMVDRKELECFNVVKRLDESEIFEIAQSLDKYTSQENATGNTANIPKIEGLNDFEEEDFEGKGMVVSIIHSIDDVWVEEYLRSDLQEWICSATDDSPRSFNVVLKSDVDGVAYKMDHSKMTHFATANAFAFVMASKRDRKYMTVYVDTQSSKTLGIVVEASRNVFIYSHENRTDTKSGQQYIFDMKGLEMGFSFGALKDQGVVGFSISKGYIVILRD